MEAVDFQVVLKQVAALSGIDQDAIPNSFFTQIRDFADRRVSQAWDRAEWPESIRYNSPTVNTSGNINKFTYPTGADVILNVYSEDPRTSTKLKTYSYTLTDTGSAREVILPEADTSVTVEYKEAAPTFTGDTYTTGSDYANGDQVYAEGNFWNITATLSNAAAFSLIKSQGHATLEKCPKLFQGYMVKGCYADYLRSNGQTQEAAIEDNMAEGLLYREVEKLTRQQGQNRRVEMGVY